MNLTYITFPSVLHFDLHLWGHTPQNRGVYSGVPPPLSGGGKRNQKFKNREEKSKGKRKKESEKGWKGKKRKRKREKERRKSVQKVKGKETCNFHPCILSSNREKRRRKCWKKLGENERKPVNLLLNSLPCMSCQIFRFRNLGKRNQKFKKTGKENQL